MGNFPAKTCRVSPAPPHTHTYLALHQNPPAGSPSTKPHSLGCGARLGSFLGRNAVIYAHTPGWATLLLHPPHRSSHSLASRPMARRGAGGGIKTHPQKISDHPRPVSGCYRRPPSSCPDPPGPCSPLRGDSEEDPHGRPQPRYSLPMAAAGPALPQPLSPLLALPQPPP